MRRRLVSNRSKPALMRCGQALVEFALVAPIFFLLLFAIIEGGRFILYYQALNNAAREGARYAIVHGSNSNCPSGPMPPGQTAPIYCYDPSGANVVKQVKDTAFGLLGSGVTVTPTWGATGNGRDSDVDVVATYTYQPLVPIVPLPAISITAESKLVINN
jgi:Flp pilus assembly protein TadG